MIKNFTDLTGKKAIVTGGADSKTKATVCQKKLAVILILSNAGTSFDDYFQVHSNEWSADRI